MSVQHSGSPSIELDLWDFPHLQIPELSYLYHLEPIGIGTPGIECFTSYLSRLAAAHNVTVLSLVDKEIKRFLPEGSNGPRNHQSIIYGPHARALNGLERMAKHWVATLESLTLRRDLSLLTMLRWCEVLPPQGVIRNERAWCPNCYQEWQAEDKTIFDPLIWSIKTIQICTHHARELVNRCPHCLKTLPVLGSHHRVGYCSRCMKWLGSSRDGTASGNSLNQNGVTEWQKWVSNNVGELLALPAECPSPNKERVPGILKAFARKSPRQSLLGFAEWLQAPTNSVIYWCNGNSLPRLSALLYICYRLGITLVEFLTKDNIVRELNTASSYTGITYENRKKHPRDRELIRRALEEVISSEEEPPPSMLTVSRRLGINVWDLRGMFSELCKRISAKHKQHQQDYRLINLDLVRGEIKRISLELHGKGLEPTRGRISPRMNKSGYFRDKRVQDALMTIRRELGYESS